EELAQRDYFQPSIAIILYAVLPMSWTAFECVAKDTWVACLDAGNTTAGHRAIRSLSNKDAVGGLAAKHINIEMLAKHNFDIRNRLGTVLADKFDFTGMDGIRRAYRSAFAQNASELGFLDVADLDQLQSYRNLIVHRGGIADEAFTKRTATSLAVGDRVVLSGDLVAAFVESAVRSGVELLKFADCWLMSNGSS
ncbi:MAG: hypothetical protein V3T70_11315, partial [Phycisphaerae bacterium]